MRFSLHRRQRNLITIKMASSQVPEQSVRELRAGKHEGQVRPSDAIEFAQPWLPVGGRGRLRVVRNPTETVNTLFHLQSHLHLRVSDF